MEQAKQRYQRILELAKKFNNFNNQFNRIENSMPPESLIKLRNLENLNFSTTQKGKEQWQILDRIPLVSSAPNGIFCIQ